MTPIGVNKSSSFPAKRRGEGEGDGEGETEGEGEGEREGEEGEDIGGGVRGREMGGIE